MFELDIRSRQPIYEQLVEKIKEFIIHEVWGPNEQLPSVRLLAKELTINPNTIQKAYRELEHQGYIYSIPGKGHFVATQPEEVSREKLETAKQQLLKLLCEAFYIGMKKDAILSLVDEAEQIAGGGDPR
ncbi:bacterial regulatory s, gntR family protein [Anoxybacillus sp. B7M1]|jgi:GntR family transcriptional regulator|uniref:GntR family transcriptional regulator n=1 Tax=Anoxybacteroides rupiense TaxID=311460 RepID=A0ABD5IT54_9BACL|nr:MULTISPECIES: GntR family transcriptional regulator [Anoxybacillus]ANB63181.1 bacterial regulatory s, gntR family protein [Anoxybacillus sp. B7M1]KXG09358.1 HTH-type transcriptional repressor YtrA [Anoxybacillus sp. P3H1B]MBS2771850.1 GntR family transcriptional regulator [Anoxybacillus rupiensis]MED5051383.1 GntR family transcriptional regulator [Anoxybacillus rupiensis]OQM46087.1 GntR family transcriptional regulator [Anoxybacillus sp. UARK-01]